MSDETKREEAAAEDEKNRPIEDAEAEKVVGGSGSGPPSPPSETIDTGPTSHPGDDLAGSGGEDAAISAV